MELVDLLKRPEGRTLVFKRDISTPEGALRTIVAFANTAGGTLLVGVEDRSRRVRAVGDPLALEERLARLISDRVTPRIVAVAGNNNRNDCFAETRVRHMKYHVT